jgi:hypothetical protein
LPKTPCLFMQPKICQTSEEKKYLGNCWHILIQFLFLEHFFVSFYHSERFQSLCCQLLLNIVWDELRMTLLQKTKKEGKKQNKTPIHTYLH